MAPERRGWQLSTRSGRKLALLNISVENANSHMGRKTPEASPSLRYTSRVHTEFLQYTVILLLRSPPLDAEGQWLAWMAALSE